MIYRTYQLLGWLFFIICFLPYFLYSLVVGRNYDGFGQRLGFIDKIEKEKHRSLKVWLHAASVGEVQVARALIAELKKIVPLASFVLSVMTEQGRKVAEEYLGSEVRVIYAPLDLYGIVGKTLKAIRPDVYICLETEIWPNIIVQAYMEGVKLILLNGRMSDRSFNRYRFIHRFIKELLSYFAVISVIQTLDAERYVALGAESSKVIVNGNAKYDLVGEHDPEALTHRCQSMLGVKPNQPLLVTGSTHTGEEELLIRVYNDLKLHESVNEELVWVVAPRHLERLAEVERIFAINQINYMLLSEVKQHGRKASVILVDLMGRLADIYSIATYVFCGGSLVKRGGHNIIEAAVWGKPVFYGPYMDDFADAADLLESVGAGYKVQNTEELSKKIQYFANHKEEYAVAGKRAREVALAQQGSAFKQAHLVLDVLERKR